MWKRREGGNQHNYIDGRTHVHHIHLVNEETGGEHHLQILLNGLPCPHCKRHFDSKGEFDPKVIVEAELKLLNANHEALIAYATKHGVPIQTGPLSRHGENMVRIKK